MKQDILIAGNILADSVKRIDGYPKIGMLANIESVQRSVGGCVPNVAIDLKKLAPALPVGAAGLVGNDEAGDFVVGQMERVGVDCSAVKRTDAAPTSFTDVMSLPSGERTFFHARGANAQFSPADAPAQTLDCRLLHAGYLLLLDRFDAPDPEFGTVMARWLHDVKARGIKTSLDAVSSAADYKGIVTPALRYCDYFIVNELESSMLSGLPPYAPTGELLPENIEKTARYIAQCGVSEKVVIHCKQAGFCLDCATGKFTCVPSLPVPKEEIRGSVGAGDAFCAGTLFGILHGFSDEKTLSFAAGAAACSLFAENSVDAMRPANEIEALIERLGFTTIS